MDRQIFAILKAANFNLYRLGKVRGHLTTEATKILVHSLVITHLDYANSLLAGLPQKKLRPHQSVQDSAARLIYRGAISTEVSRFLLHWLPINFRALFKILLLVFDCLQGTATVYLRKCIRIRSHSHWGKKPWSYVFNHEKKEEEELHTKAGLPEEVFHIRPAPLEQTATGHLLHKHQTRLDFKKLLNTHLFTL